MLKTLPIFLCILTLQLPAAELEPSPKMKPTTNRLAQETSPYLLQHATNPVDWFPWGEEAFAKARKENKLIFLSSGYSTCHWCHVMERESFKNEEIAALINKHFVAIKLDREERPDVNQIYMTAHSAMSGGSGGWPLNMFLLPDLKPLYGGTYFPPTSRQGRPGFPQILEHLGTAWEKNPADLTKNAHDFTSKLNDFLKPDPETENKTQELPTNTILAAARDRLMGMADHENGGLGQAPKFPQVSSLRFLLHRGEKDAVNFVLKTCDVMQNAGIHDQIGGGFHRYATDETWLTPHFEKMLYDQAQLIDLYLDAALISDDPQKAETYNATARKTAHYILTEMTDQNGGFLSAQDAQSEGKEGKYFCWTTTELQALLTEEEFTLATKHYGLTDKGNFLDFSDPDPLPNQNILSIITPLRDFTPEEQHTLQNVIAKMTTNRAKKVPP